MAAIERKTTWCTPPELVEAARTALGGTIDLDPCSNPHSTVGATTEFLLPHNNGLTDEWAGNTIFVNPPYGRDKEAGTSLIDWFKKIKEAADRGAEIVVLVPVSPNTRHWKDYVFGKATAICFLSAPRLKFYINGERDPKGAPMACATIYYGKHPTRFTQAFQAHGNIVNL